MKTSYQVCQQLQMNFNHSIFTQFKSLGSTLLILASNIKSLKMTTNIGKKAH
jgi:hypothetical protein